MALQYLLAPTFQFVNTAGKPLSGGAYMEVYVHGTRTKYFCASDFDGTLHPFRIPLDSLGSNIVLANDTGSYDVYAYNRYGTLMMSRYNVKPGAGGGIGGTITSTDGSIDIHPTEDGVDLSVNGLDPSCLKVSADPRTTDGKFHFDTLVQEGDQAYVDNEGAIRLIKGWYHFTANVQLAWTAGARNETHQITLYTTLSNSVIDFDISHVHTETIELSGDVSIAQDGAELVIGVSGMPTGLEASVIGMDVHAITGKDGHDKYYAGNGITISNENYIAADFDSVQEKLVAGENISITGNVISAPSLVQVNSDWDAEEGEPGYIENKPNLDVYATQAQLSYGLAGKQDVISDLSAIRSGAQAGASAVQPADLAAVATTGNYNSLNNRPNLTVYATKTEMNNGLATKQDVIDDLSDIRSGAQAGSTAVQPSDLATVATTGSYDDLVDKPSIPAAQVNSDWDATSGVTAILNRPNLATVATTGDYTDLVNKPSIPAAQVNADWDATSGVEQILNRPNLATVATTGDYDDLNDKPDLSIYAQSANLAAVATTGDYDDLVNKPNIPAAQVNADWNSSSGVSQILNRPNLATVATTGAYSDLTGTPTINNVPAVTSSDNDKVLKASYSGGVGSYSWQTEQGGGSTYTAGDGIDITNDEISVLYDSDTMELKPTSETHTYELGTWYENHGRAYVEVDSTVKDILEYAPNKMLTIHIPGNTFSMQNPNSLYVKLSADEYFNHEGNYIAQELSTTFDSATNTTWVDEQDIVVSSGYYVYPDPEYWHFEYELEEANYIGIGINRGSDLCSITSAAAGAGVTMSFSAATGDPELAVKNPLPASAIGDATKVLTVDNTGAPVWATAQAPISAGTGIDITNNVVSVDTSVVATQTDLASKQDTISDLATIRSGAAEGATAVQPGDLATVATTGDYSDLTGTPTIPTVSDNVAKLQYGVATYAQVVAAFNAGKSIYLYNGDTDDGVVSSDITFGDDGAEIIFSRHNVYGAAGSRTEYKVTSSNVWSTTTKSVAVPTVDQSYSSSSANAQSGIAVAQAIAAIPSSSYTAGDGIDITNNVVTAKVDGTTIDTNASGELTVIGGDDGADWDAEQGEPGYIENKPVPKTLTAGAGISITENASTITIANTVTPPTVDQTYSAASTNAQSGTAVAEALDSLGTDRTVIMNTPQASSTSQMTLTEPFSNFEYIEIYATWDYNGVQRIQAFARFPGNQTVFNVSGFGCANRSQSNYGFFLVTLDCSVSGTTITVNRALRSLADNSLTSNTDSLIVQKIVGIHRVASN